MAEEPNPNPEPDPTPNPDPTPDPTPAPDPDPEGDPPAFDYKAYVDGLEDGDVKNYASRFNSFEDIAQGAINMRKELSSRPKAPGEDATDEEKAEYRKQQGIPSEAAEYEVKFPDEYEVPDQVEALMEGIKEAAHANDLNQATLQGFVDKYLEVEAAAQEAQAKAVQDAAAEATDELRKEWTKDFEKNLNIAKRARQTFGDEALEEAMDALVPGTNTKLGDFPPLARFMHKVGARMGEDGILAPVTTDDRQTIQDRINAIKKENPVGSAGYRSNKVQAELQDLHEQLYGAN